MCLTHHVAALSYGMCAKGVPVQLHAQTGTWHVHAHAGSVKWWELGHGRHEQAFLWHHVMVQGVACKLPCALHHVAMLGHET